jgi:hypothetical protein
MTYHPVPTDYWRWTQDGLVKVLGAAGFEVVEVTGIIGVPATGVQFLLDSLRPRLPGGLQALFNLLMQGVIALVDWSTPKVQRDRDASIFLVVATVA